MYSYIPKSQWGAYADQKQVPTIDDLLKLCKAGEVERVIIPNTYYGYGASLIDESNRRSIKRHYAENKFKDVQYSLTCSGYQFKKHDWLRDLFVELTEQYPIFDEQDYANLEDETKISYVIDELFHDDEIELTREEISEILFSGEWSKSDSGFIEYSFDRIEYWEYCEIDNDGATPYMSEDNFALLKAEFLKRRDELAKEQ